MTAMLMSATRPLMTRVASSKAVSGPATPSSAVVASVSMRLRIPYSRSRSWTTLDSRHLVNVLGDLLGELLAGVDERGHEQQGRAAHHAEAEEVDEQDRHGPAQQQPLLQEVDQRVDRDGQEGGDADPRQDPPRQPHEVGQQRDRAEHGDDAQDGAGGRPLGGHPGCFLGPCRESSG